MKKISVIIPVYKVENYLRACIDSVLASTYTNLEIILVDDGSPDNCPGICDESAGKDARIKVIHQENQGIVGARNTGLRHATGDYVAFADSDDSVSPILYEQLVRAIERTDSDLAACEYTDNTASLCTSAEAVRKSHLLFSGADELISVLTCTHSVRNRTWTSCYIWNKLYRRDRIQFEFRKECLMCEDLRFNWDYMKTCRTMVVVPAPLYYYRLNEGSITGIYKLQTNNPKMVMNGIRNAQTWDVIAHNSPITSPALIDYLHNRAAYTAHGALWRVYCAGVEREHSQYVQEARALLRSYCSKLFRDRETYNVKVRAVVWLCRYVFPLWKLAARLSAVLK